MLTPDEVAIKERCVISDKCGWESIEVSTGSLISLLATIEELRETIAILGRSVNSTADMVTERNAKIAALHEALAQARNALESGV
jgi:hypothetical protein